MRRVSAKGVLIGGIVDIVTSAAFGALFAFYAMLKLDLSNTPKAETADALTAAIHANVPLYLSQLLVGLLCSVLGGYVAARIAKHDELLNGGLSSLLCLALGAYMVVSGGDSSPLWGQLLLFLASPLFAILGGNLMRRQRRCLGRAD